MIQRAKDFCDYTALFGAICLIPTGFDGDLVLPIFGSLSLIGVGLAGRLGILLSDSLFN